MVQQVGGLVPTASKVSNSPDIWSQIGSILITLVLVGIILLVIVLIIRWFMGRKTKKERIDIYTEDYKRTIDLCKVHKNPKFIKSIPGLPQFIASKGVTVMIRYPPLDYSKQYVNRPDSESLQTQGAGSGQLLTNITSGGTYKLGNYAGSCFTTDGCFNLLIKSSKNKIMGIFPKMLVVKMRLPYRQKVPDSKDKTKTEFIEVPADSFSLSEDIIIIDSLGLEKVNLYYYCVNMDKDGHVVNTRPYIYQDLIEISTTRQLIDVGRNMAMVAEDWVRSNPLVQFVRKTDSGLTTE